THILIAGMGPQQRQARNQVIQVRSQNRGQIPDAQLEQLAKQILPADQLETYQKISKTPAQALSDDDRALLKQFHTQLGVRGVDVDSPDTYLSAPQQQARQQVITIRQQNNG